MNAGFGSWLFRVSLGASALGELADGRWSEWRGLQRRILRLGRLRLRGPLARRTRRGSCWRPPLRTLCEPTHLIGFVNVGMQSYFKVGLSMPEYTPKLDRTVASTPESPRGTGC
jgi:hypothetical protein